MARLKMGREVKELKIPKVQSRRYHKVTKKGREGREKAFQSSLGYLFRPV